MKCTSKGYTYEAGDILVSVEEVPAGGMRVSLAKRRTNFTWEGDLKDIAELGETCTSIEALHGVGTSPMPTLNAAEPEERTAEPPKLRDGELLMKLTVTQYREIVDLANDIIAAGSSRTWEWDSRGVNLARKINDVFAGEVIR